MKRVGFVFEEGKAPPRQGAIIQFDGEEIGTVTSGTVLNHRSFHTTRPMSQTL